MRLRHAARAGGGYESEGGAFCLRCTYCPSRGITQISLSEWPFPRRVGSRNSRASPKCVQLVSGGPDLLQSSRSFYYLQWWKKQKQFNRRYFHAGLALGSPSIGEKSNWRWHTVSIYQFGRYLKNVCTLWFNNSALEKWSYRTKVNVFLFTVAFIILHIQR